MRKGHNSDRYGTIPFRQPSAMAPKTKTPDSFNSHWSENKRSLIIGNKIGKNSVRNTFAKRSNAAAEHFLKVQLEMYSSLSSSISS